MTRSKLLPPVRRAIALAYAKPEPRPFRKRPYALSVWFDVTVVVLFVVFALAATL